MITMMCIIGDIPMRVEVDERYSVKVGRRVRIRDITGKDESFGQWFFVVVDEIDDNGYFHASKV